MLTLNEHLDNLMQHINRVRENCLILGKKFIAQGKTEFGVSLIKRGYGHDLSKFEGIEWRFLHMGSDVPKDKLELAILQHTLTNDHHPEYFNGINEMHSLALAEMVCDWAARSAEFGTGVKDWIRGTAVERYKIDINGETFEEIMMYVNMLTESHFVK